MGDLNTLKICQKSSKTPSQTRLRFSIFLTQANHWNNRMVNTRLNTLEPKRLYRTGGEGPFLFGEQTLGNSFPFP